MKKIAKISLVILLVVLCGIVGFKLISDNNVIKTITKISSSEMIRANDSISNEPYGGINKIIYWGKTVNESQQNRIRIVDGIDEWGYCFWKYNTCTNHKRRRGNNCL